VEVNELNVEIEGRSNGDFVIFLHENEQINGEIEFYCKRVIIRSRFFTSPQNPQTIHAL
jgi:hypothetical protein